MCVRVSVSGCGRKNAKNRLDLNTENVRKKQEKGRPGWVSLYKKSRKHVVISIPCGTDEQRRKSKVLRNTSILRVMCWVFDPRVPPCRYIPNDWLAAELRCALAVVVRPICVRVSATVLVVLPVAPICGPDWYLPRAVRSCGVAI